MISSSDKARKIVVLPALSSPSTRIRASRSSRFKVRSILSSPYVWPTIDLYNNGGHSSTIPLLLIPTLLSSRSEYRSVLFLSYRVSLKFQVYLEEVCS